MKSLSWVLVVIALAMGYGLVFGDHTKDTTTTYTAPVSDYNDAATLSAAVELQMNEALAPDNVTVTVFCLPSGVDHRFACQARSPRGSVANQDVVVSSDGTSYVAAN